MGMSFTIHVAAGYIGATTWGFLRKTDPGSRTHSLVIKRLDE